MRIAPALLLGLAVLAVNHAPALAQTSASLTLPVVTDEVRDGVRELQVIFPGQGRTVECFKPAATQPFKKQTYNKDGVLVEEKLFDERARLISAFKLESDMSKHWQSFEPDSGKLAVEKRQLASGKFVETRYRPDGETVWTVTETEADGHVSSVRYISPDGRTLVRRFTATEMTVDVFGKDHEHAYLQRWTQAGKSYRLAELRISNGRERRVVVMKDDGVTIDHVDYQISGFVGWSTLKTEAGDKLSEPVAPELLQELNRTDDPSIPAATTGAKDVK